MSSLLTKPTVQRFSITLVEERIEDFWSKRGRRLETIVFGKIWEFNHLELVKEQGLGRKESTLEEAGA